MITAQNDFRATLKKIVEHYKGDPEQAYPLPPVATDAVVSNADVHKWVNEAATEIKASVGRWEADLIKAANDLKADHNVPSFKEKLEARKTKAKKEFNDAVNRWGDTARSLADKYPEHQNALLAVFSDLANFFESALRTIGGFVENVIATIDRWIAGAAQDITNFFGEVGSAVGSFFGNLFGGRAALADTGIVKLLPSA